MFFFCIIKYILLFLQAFFRSRTLQNMVMSWGILGSIRPYSYQKLPYCSHLTHEKSEMLLDKSLCWYHLICLDRKVLLIICSILIISVHVVLFINPSLSKLCKRFACRFACKITFLKNKFIFV